MIDPGGCARKIIDIHGSAGAEWLQRLPALLASCAERWSLTILPPFARLSYNYVAPAVRDDGTPVVVKAGVPHPELWSEIAALRCFAGRGIVRLLEADPDRGVLLLERLLPGTPLDDLDDDEQVTITALQLLQRLWRPAPSSHPFPTVARWADGLARLHTCFDDGYGPFPPALIDRAEGLLRDLLAVPGEPMLLHGDLHPVNVLRGQREPWLAIDPKGVVGNRLYDVATLLNGLPERRPEGDLAGLLARRVDLAAEMLGAGREEIKGWGLAQAVLSGWWSYEDHGCGWENALARAAYYLALP